MDIVTILIVVAVSVVFGLIGGVLFFIIKMKLGERKIKKQLKSGKGIIENITLKEDFKNKKENDSDESLK